MATQINMERRYAGHTYRHIKTATNETLYNRFGHELFEVFYMNNNHRFAAFIEAAGSDTPCSLGDSYIIDETAWDDYLLVIFCDYPEDDIYSLYKKTTCD